MDGSKEFKYLLQKRRVKVATSSTGLENQFPYKKEKKLSYKTAVHGIKYLRHTI